MGRYYRTVDGVEYPSVTTVLSVMDKPALIPWAVNSTIAALRDYIGSVLTEGMLVFAKKNYRKVSRDAMDIGSEVHNAIEWYLKDGTVPKLRDEALNSFNACLQWLDTHDFKLIEAERTVFNHTYHYAGTLDVKCFLNGRVYVLDFKTSKAVYDEYAMQIAAYAACKDMEDVDGIGVLRLDKETGEPEFVDFSSDRGFHFNGFLSALDLYNRYRAPKKHRGLNDLK